MAIKVDADLRRYTDIPSLLYLLYSRKITLLDPSSWDDTNDSYFLLKYKEKKGLKSLLALCLTQTEETYHHWRVFAGGPAGICVRFDRKRFLDTFKGMDGIIKNPVRYKRVRDTKQFPVSVDDLPFIKRAGFAPESEFRIVYTSATIKESFKDIPISLDSILEIRLSPWLNKRLRHCLRDTINKIDCCKDLKVSKSTLTGNSTWKELADKAT